MEEVPNHRGEEFIDYGMCEECGQFLTGPEPHQHKRPREHCIICQEDCDFESLVTTQCGHPFCDTCLLTWCKSLTAKRVSATCPSCREVILNVILGENIVPLHEFIPDYEDLINRESSDQEEEVIEPPSPLSSPSVEVPESSEWQPSEDSSDEDDSSAPAAPADDSPGESSSDSDESSPSESSSESSSSDESSRDERSPDESREAIVAEPPASIYVQALDRSALKPGSLSHRKQSFMDEYLHLLGLARPCTLAQVRDAEEALLAGDPNAYVNNAPIISPSNPFAYQDLFVTGVSQEKIKLIAPYVIGYVIKAMGENMYVMRVRDADGQVAFVMKKLADFQKNIPGGREVHNMIVDSISTLGLRFEAYVWRPVGVNHVPEPRRDRRMVLNTFQMLPWCNSSKFMTALIGSAELAALKQLAPDHYIDHVIFKPLRPLFCLIRQILFSNEVGGGLDDQLFLDYLMWCAHIRQHPEAKPRKMFIFYSYARQIGKGGLVELLLKLLVGPLYYYEASRLEGVTTQFNGPIAEKLVVNFTEFVMPKSEQEKAMGHLRSLVTNPTDSTRRMFAEATMESSYQRFIATTNKPFPIDGGEVRFIISDTSPAYQDEIERLLAQLTTMFTTQPEMHLLLCGFMDHMPLSNGWNKASKLNLTPLAKKWLAEQKNNQSQDEVIHFIRVSVRFWAGQYVVGRTTSTLKWHSGPLFEIFREANPESRLSESDVLVQIANALAVEIQSRVSIGNSGEGRQRKGISGERQQLITNFRNCLRRNGEMNISQWEPLKRSDDSIEAAPTNDLPQGKPYFLPRWTQVRVRDALQDIVDNHGGQNIGGRNLPDWLSYQLSIMFPHQEFRLINVLGDGNCSTRAIIESLRILGVLPPLITTHEALRAAVIEFIRTDDELIARLEENHGGANDYMQRLALNGESVDEFFFEAAARYLQRPIYVYWQGQDVPTTYGDEFEEFPIRLMWEGGGVDIEPEPAMFREGHYQVIVELGDDL